MSSDKSIEEILKQVDDLEKGWDENVDRPPSDIIGHNAENADAMKSVVSKEQAPDFGENLKPDSSDPAPEAPQAPEPPTEPWARRGYELEQNRTRPPPEDPLAAKMKAAGWTPKASASAAEPDWNALQNRLQEAENRAANSRAATQSFAAVSPNQHFHYDPNIGSEDVAAAKAPLEMAQARQAYEGKQESIDTEREKGAAEASLRDPTSAESQRARDSFKAFFKDSPPPENFDQFSADDVKHYAIDPLGTVSKIRTEQDLQKFRLAEADKFARSADLADATAKTKSDAAAKTSADEATSLAIERQVAAADPRSQRITNPATGKPFTADDIAGLDRKGLDAVRKQLETMPKRGGAGGSGPAKAVHAVDDIADPSDRASAQAIIDGRSDGSGLDRKTRSRVLGLVAQIDPNFDATKYDAYKDERDKLAHDPEVVAANTALDHIKRARQNIPDNFDSQMMNKIRNAFLTGIGSDQLTPFETDVKVMADEIAKAYGANTEGGRTASESLFSGVQSKQQLLRRFDEQENLLGTRLHSKELQFENAAPKGAHIQLGPAETNNEPLVSLVAKDGRTKRVKKSVAEQFLKDHPGEATVK